MGAASARGILSYLMVWRLASGSAGRGPGSAARFMRGELNGAVASFDCAQGRCSLIAEGAMGGAPDCI
jgi:hypothetical protein